MRAEYIGAELRKEDRNLTTAEKYCVLTSGDDDVEDLNAFVAERLQCLSKGSVDKLIGDESVNLDEILCGSVGIGKDGGVFRQSVCPSLTPGGDVGAAVRRFSPGEETDRVLREELGSVNIT